jgi:hypothetical protein
VALTRTDAKQSSHRFPHFLPDGQHFLFYATGSAETGTVYVGHLDDGTSQRLLEADASAVYASSGHVVFVRQGKLFAQQFDPVAIKLSGTRFLLQNKSV